MATSKAERIMEKAGNTLRAFLRQELRTQGHRNTGGLERSITSQLVRDGQTVGVDGMVRDYGFILNFGTSAGRIPFSGASRGSGGKARSAYIQGLIGYFRSKGLSEKEATRAAFATAITQKKKGMPTPGSFRYSKNGDRLHAIDKTRALLNDRVDRQVSLDFDAAVSDLFNKTKSETV